MISKDDAPQFDGFDYPDQNWFKMPKDWTNITAGIKSIAEIKVVEYVLKHTWGYQEFGILKRITLDEFMHGRKNSDGNRIDNGTGLSDEGVRQGIRLGVADGLLEESIDARDMGRVRRSYGIKMRIPKDVDTGAKTFGPKTIDPIAKDSGTRGQRFRPRTEKETKERSGDIDLDKHRRSVERLYGPDGRPSLDFTQDKTL